MTHSKKPPKRPLRRLHVALEELEDRGLGLAHAHAALAAAAREAALAVVLRGPLVHAGQHLHGQDYNRAGK